MQAPQTRLGRLLHRLSDVLHCLRASCKTSILPCGSRCPGDDCVQGCFLAVVGGGGKSKLARAVRRNAIIGDPDLLIGPDVELLEGLDKKWAIEDSKL